MCSNTAYGFIYGGKTVGNACLLISREYNYAPIPRHYVLISSDDSVINLRARVRREVISSEEMQRRRTHVQTAIADNRIEGIPVSRAEHKSGGPGLLFVALSYSRVRLRRTQNR